MLSCTPTLPYISYFKTYTLLSLDKCKETICEFIHCSNLITFYSNIRMLTIMISTPITRIFLSFFFHLSRFICRNGFISCCKLLTCSCEMEIRTRMLMCEYTDDSEFNNLCVLNSVKDERAFSDTAQDPAVMLRDR